MKLFLTLLLLSTLPAIALAQEVMDIPVASASPTQEIETTHPILRLSQDKSELITLKDAAVSVIVGNPAHISVLLDTPETLIVVPRQAGASHFTVIGKDGSTLMQRHVVVGGPKEKYIRIRRSCDSNDTSCQATSTYFCPDVCHEVSDTAEGTGRRR